MKKLLLLICLLTSCADVRYTKSKLLQENAHVLNVVHTPSRHSVDVVPVLDFDGDLTMRIVTSTVPEKWATVFSCQHGQFIVNGLPTYAAMQPYVSKPVVVEYTELYKEVWEAPEGKPEKQIKTKEIIGYDFLRATPSVIH